MCLGAFEGVMLLENLCLPDRQPRTVLCDGYLWVRHCVIEIGVLKMDQESRKLIRIIFSP